MHLRRQLSGAGAVLAAAAAVVLSGSPAHAAEGTGLGTNSTDKWQIGMQLGSAPIELTGSGGPLAELLYVAPVGEIAVESSTGQNLLRLDAASFRTDTAGPALPDDLGLVQPVGGVRVGDQNRARTPATATRAPVAAPAPSTGQVDSAAAPAPVQSPLRAEGGATALDSPFNWVPIQALGGFGPDGAGLPWATGIALVVLTAGTAGAHAAARRRLGASNSL
ncbi:MAG TPA: hypothetical protein VMZ00_00750 [Sporichthya sp.]|nr:hypothetical protein [Sporichthya sp.]